MQGLANAGYGFLDADWLANTRDPTPVFSLLVEISYRIFNTSYIFYFYYALLMGIYLFSLSGIISIIFGMADSKTKQYIFIGLLFVIHSAALRQGFVITLGEDWRYVLEGGVAGQRILGFVFQPSAFGVLLIVSIYQFLRGRVYISAALVALAATLHPTYLLAAAVLTLAFMLITFLETRNFSRTFLIGFTSLILVSPILIYSLTIFTPSSPETYARAQDALVNFRIPHHAIPAEWFNSSVVVQLSIILLAIFVLRKSRLFWMLVLPTVAAVSLTILQFMLNNHSLALLFPWRLSVILVPLSTSVLVVYGLTKLWPRISELIEHRQKLAKGVGTAAILVLMVAGILRFKIQIDRKRDAPEVAVLSFISDNLEEGQFFMIPIGMQSFRLETGAPVTVDFLAIPYKDGEVTQWLTRVHNINRFYRDNNKPGNCDFLRILANEFTATHVVLPEENFDLNCDFLGEIYRDNSYSVRLIKLLEG